MATEILSVDAHSPAAAAIARASALLRAGGLVAFPTETVYGLGANALDAAAVARIFQAKGRPAHNPIIVHVADAGAASHLVTHWPETAQRLAERFWPGPLTVVLPKSERIPDLVTAGAATVALRVPAHPVALALLRASALPIAAPSANRSTALSPTRGEHVLRGLDGRFDLLLDAGPTPGGLESTVLDLTQAPPRLLRPGLVTPADLEAIVGPVVLAERPTSPLAEPLPSPGLLECHYAPVTPLEGVAPDVWPRVRELAARGLRIGWVTFAAPKELPDNVVARVLPRQPDQYAAKFYAILHELDQAGVDRIVVDLPPDTVEWLAVRDRLARAAGSLDKTMQPVRQRL